MFIGQEIIAKALSKYDSQVFKSDTDYCITSFVPLETSIKPFTEHVLYLVFSPEELKNAELIPYINLLIFNPEKKDISLYLDEKIPVNYTELFTDDVHGAIVCLRDYFNDVIGSGLMAGTVLDILFHERSIQDMVDSFIRGFNNPVFVFDAGFHLLAANYDMVQGHEMSERIINNKGLSDEDFKLLNSKELPYDVIRKSEKPLKMYHEEVGFEQMICPIDSKKDMGHIVISAVNRPFNETDEKLLVILKEGIHQQLIKQDFIRNNAGFPYEYFLKDLLDGKIATKLHSYDRMDYVNMEFSGNMYCMVIETARSTGTLNIFRIRSDFGSLIPDTKTLLYNGEIIVIFELRVGESLPEKISKKIAALCKKYGLYAGMSNNFSNIIDLSAYYKQALRAIELGAAENNDPGLYIYSKYYMQHLFNIFTQKSDVRAFCYSKLQIVLDYDQKNGTDLAYSLYMYLICERNSIAASEAMFIHRNTLLYRLKKIDAMVDIDYENYDERRYLILSYEMVKNSPESFK